MESFRHDGHLTDAALTALIQGQPLDELERLEMAEHLAYCDQCLQRYTELLCEDTLLTPRESCRDSLLRRIRRRTVQLVTSRYATAAAAVALALTLLWGGLDFSSPHRQPSVQPDGEPSVTERLTSWPEHWTHAMNTVFDRLDELFH